MDSRSDPTHARFGSQSASWLRHLTYERAVAAILVYGVAVRLVHYLAGRPLWRDEAALALNIVNRSFAGLIQPLDYNQAAPLGFLALEKATILVGGHSEYALRFWPLVFGS